VGVSTTPVTASPQSKPNRPSATRNCGVSYSVPQSTVQSVSSKYRFISEGRHSLRHARLAIGRAVPAPAPAPRPRGLIHGLWWRSGVSSRSTFASQTPRPRPQFICSSLGEGRVFPEFVAGLPACRSDRPHGQPASNSQHQPALSLLVNFDRGIGSCCTSNHNLQATGHGTWPSPIAPSPILPNRSRAPRTVDERPSNRGREPAKAGWETEGTRAQHKSKHRGAAGSSVELDPILSDES
jgi:hypothetical protein